MTFCGPSREFTVKALLTWLLNGRHSVQEALDRSCFLHDLLQVLEQVQDGKRLHSLGSRPSDVSEEKEEGGGVAAGVKNGLLLSRSRSLSHVPQK
ncbi:unnamed protein product [Bursaphelenchus xylophilus]|uniref:(pine wood nematode) hypothetical protein n=1 Tax=Bursaphelenchus xylophilus TaxID=6326 RepID=A0A1I7STC6_BURXY|nr:unnamed protein product [Bursaphelenchus xylophilus]CAG9108569.1 unnamed protein product [Bursaphelenchus xylophilus]